MSKKNLKLIIILLVLIGIAWAWEIPGKKWLEERSAPANIFKGIDFTKIDKLEIEKGGKKTILEREGEKLRIGGSKSFYVRQDIAQMVWDGLKKAAASQAELASTNKEKAIEFGLDEGQAVKITFMSGNAASSSILIGRPGPDYSSVYAKLPDAAETLLVKENLQNVFERDEWRDMSIFSSDREKISKLRFQFPGREFTIEKKDGKWKGTIPVKFDAKPEKLDEILAIMSSLTAQEIPAQDFKAAGFDKGGVIVQATGDGVDNTLMLGRDNGKGRVYAKSGASDNIYLISADQKKSLDKKQGDFK
jgi:hypothetical protein